MKVIKKENLAIVVRTYTNQNGQEKKVWKTIGELTTFQGNDNQFQSVELYTIPNARISVFSQEKRSTQQTPQTPQTQEINVEEIPF